MSSKDGPTPTSAFETTAIDAFLRTLFASAKLSPPGNIRRFLMMPPITQVAAPCVATYWEDLECMRTAALACCELMGPTRAPEPIRDLEKRLSDFITYHFRPEWAFEHVEA